MLVDERDDDLTQHWTLSPLEHALLANKAGPTRLGFALLLKAFQRDGRFPDRVDDLPDRVRRYVAQQVGVIPDVTTLDDWPERTERRQRAHILAYCGFRPFHAADEPPLIAWLSAQVTSLDPDTTRLQQAAYTYLRSRQIEPPAEPRLHRLLVAAVRQCESHFCSATVQHLSPTTQQALDALIQTDLAEDAAGQTSLFPVQSELAALKDDTGAVKVETVLETIRKLQQLRALQLPPDLFRDVPTKLIAQYRRRAATEPPRELRRHPPAVRFTLLAALCWQRMREITDMLVELLIHIAHRIGVRAEEKVDAELLKHLRKVAGKTKLLYTLARVAKQHPDRVIKEVIYPAVGEHTLDALIQEAEADATYETRVRLVTRASYGHHYRRIVPTLLDVLEFRCNNEGHRPIMQALDLVRRYRDRKTTVFPRTEYVPLDGVVKDNWHDLVLDEQDSGRVNRMPTKYVY